MIVQSSNTLVALKADDIEQFQVINHSPYYDNDMLLSVY